jgi:hypothetical protein
MRFFIGTASRAAGSQFGASFAPRAARRLVFLAREMIFDVTGNLLAHGRQIKQLVFDERVVGPLGNVPIYGRMRA